jgi:hypothetical protein
MSATVVPAPAGNAGDPLSQVRAVRCQAGTGRCPNDAEVVLIENARQLHAKRYLCAKHYLATYPAA